MLRSAELSEIFEDGFERRGAEALRHAPERAPERAPKCSGL